jgi:hypothetical protein
MQDPEAFGGGEGGEGEKGRVKTHRLIAVLTEPATGLRDEPYEISPRVL